MSETYTMTGRLTDSRTVALDEAVPISSGRVRVVVECLDGEGQPSYREVIEAIHERQRQRGHQPPSAEAVNAYIRAEREGWRE